jgi:hypothetical protein
VRTWHRGGEVTEMWPESERGQAWPWCPLNPLPLLPLAAPLQKSVSKQASEMQSVWSASAQGRDQRVPGKWKGEQAHAALHEASRLSFLPGPQCP